MLLKMIQTEEVEKFFNSARLTRAKRRKLLRKRLQHVLKTNSPPIPGFTCPHIDEIQKKLEDIRYQNEDLRDSGKFWRGAAMSLLEECCELNKYIKELEEE